MYKILRGTKVLSLDIWGTLLRGNSTFGRRRVRLIFDMLGLSGIDDEALYEAYRQANCHYNKASELSGRDYGLAYRLELMFEQLGIKADLPDEQLLIDIQLAVRDERLRPENMPKLIEPDLPDTLWKLHRQDYILVYISNTGSDDHRVMVPVLQALGIWDQIHLAVFSSEDGRAKPHKQLYIDTADKVGVNPHEMAHFGDNLVADYFGAHCAGAQSVLYAPDGSEHNHIRRLSQLTEQ